MAGEIVAQDATGAPFSANSVVSVRCTVTSITGKGAGAAVVLAVENNGAVGARAASFTVGPSQVRIASHGSQLGSSTVGQS